LEENEDDASLKTEVQPRCSARKRKFCN